MKRYIVIGGSGFVGKYAINALKEAIEISRIKKGEIINIDITPPNAKMAKFIKCDIAKNVDFKFLQNDVVIHLAARAYSPKPPIKAFAPHCLKEYFFNVNVCGTKNILQKMQECGCKNLIYFSTDMVYGVPQYLPIDTSHPRNPIGYYGKSKKEAEDLICKNATGGGGFVLQYSAQG
ncbi:NAD-dependent epimerase/dehydratase family protein [Helicobacter sp. 23-1045]